MKQRWPQAITQTSQAITKRVARLRAGTESGLELRFDIAQGSRSADPVNNLRLLLDSWWSRGCAAGNRRVSRF